MLRFRSRTADILILKLSFVIPNSSLLRKYEATFALWIFAGETGYVRARATDTFALDDCGPHSLFRESPGDVLTRFAAAQHEEIIFFR